MNEKEIAEIRRRFKPDKSNISRIRGCYIGDNREIISEFNESLGLMMQNEAEALLTILKKALSGTIGKNLLDIEFSTEQVLHAPEHKLLMDLRKSGLEDDALVKALYEKIIPTVQLEGGYLILLASDKYDIPAFSKNGEESGDSTEMFSYFLCAVCPIKLTKTALGYHAYESKFCSIGADCMVAPPEIGFMFPAFDDRTANIYKTLYYTRSTAVHQTDFVSSLFAAEIPMPASEQKEIFESILSDTVAEDCSMNVVKAVQREFADIITEHQETKKDEPLVVTKETIKDVLESCGVPETRVKAFEERYDTEFGENAEISPRNLIETGRLEVAMPDVSIKVSADHSELIKTRIIDGVKYIMIRADETVEVNGIRIAINK